MSHFLRRFFILKICLNINLNTIFKKCENPYIVVTIELSKGGVKKMNKKIGSSLLAAAMVMSGLSSGVTSVMAQDILKEGNVVIGNSTNYDDSKVYAAKDLQSLKDAAEGYYFDVVDAENSEKQMRVTKVQKDIYHIDECTANYKADGPTNNGSSMYLVVGKDRADLIDGGNGENGNTHFSDNILKQIIDTLAPQGLSSSIITHSHGDHVGLFVDETVNNYQVLGKNAVLKIHEGDLASLSSTIKNGEFKIETFKNGDSVTAGDRQFKVYNLKGHTDGSCALLDEEDHVAFTGDALGSGTIWFGNGKDQLVDLKKDVDLFVSTVKDMDDLALYTGHRWQEAQGDAHSNGVAVQEIGQQYVFEMQELLNNIAENNYDVNSDFAPAGGNPNASAIYSEDADLNKDGYYPGIFVRGQDPVKELQSSTNIIGGNLTKALNAIQTPLTEKDGSKKEYALSSTLRSHLSQENLMAEKDENNKTLTIDQQLDGVFLSSDYVNGKSEAGISYYNMLNFYATLLQARQMLEANEGYKIVDNQGKEYDLALIDEFIGLVKQINDFDPTTDLKYDWKSAYDIEEFKNETQRGGVDVIATSKEGNISFEFHIDSHGWWGYDLGAHDSITGLVLGLDAETAKEQQHDLTLNYGQFFVIKMKENDKGTWYLLNGTDLENPIIYVSKDKKEAFMIDVDMYGGNALNDVIKSVIGEECKTLNIFLTHNHGDHINNLAVIGQDEQLRKITTIYWPENEPHVTLTDKDGTVKELVGKDLVSDIQWKEVKTLKDMEKFTAAGVEFQFIEIPNEHTPGGGQLADLTNKVIYSGDTLGAQIHLGGTTVRSNSAQAWLDGAKKASKYIEENDIQYIIGGHTPYLNNPEFASWLATGIEYAMKNATDGYNLIVVEDGKVINGTDRFGEVMGNGLTDREELNICSLGYIKSAPEDPTPEDPTDPTPEDPQKPAISDTEETKKEQTGEQVKTGDEMNIYGYALTFVAASLLFVLLKKRKLNK